MGDHEARGSHGSRRWRQEFGGGASNTYPRRPNPPRLAACNGVLRRSIELTKGGSVSPPLHLCSLAGRGVVPRGALSTPTRPPLERELVNARTTTNGTPPSATCLGDKLSPPSDSLGSLVNLPSSRSLLFFPDERTKPAWRTGGNLYAPTGFGQPPDAPNERTKVATAASHRRRPECFAAKHEIGPTRWLA